MQAVEAIQRHRYSRLQVFNTKLAAETPHAFLEWARAAAGVHGQHFSIEYQAVCSNSSNCLCNFWQAECYVAPGSGINFYFSAILVDLYARTIELVFKRGGPKSR